ncbi:MAG: septum formation initiator family protein [Faecalibacterium sp.]|nr:septum formation initiator family protein [Ruminococcus sp.]MCM1392795.1 septum formation initiator family protein [Ruminococcus sp.]MCM1485527.1 septum formation initiator family protein [Faecalibacterium sp.]
MKKLLIALAVVIALTFTISVSAVNYSKAYDYKSQTAAAKAECEEVKKEIQKDIDLINGKGFDEYCEKIAREKYDYAKPGEYVIYDSSFGN